MPPVTRPTSGSVISPASITGMHQSVRAILNDVPADSLDREGLGSIHLPSLILGHSYVPFGTGSPPPAAVLLVNYPPNFSDYSSVNIRDEWQTISNVAYVAPTGVFTRPCYLAIFATFRAQEWIITPDSRVQCWANLYYKKDGAYVYNPDFNRMVFSFQGVGVPMGTYHQTRIEESFTLVHILDWSDGAHTLGELGIKAALNQGTGAVAPASLSIPHGGIGFIAFAAG